MAGAQRALSHRLGSLRFTSKFSRWIWAEGILREEICTGAEEDESTHVSQVMEALTPEDQEGIL